MSTKAKKEKTSASSKKGLTKFCRIYVYIEQREPGFAELIRSMCLEGMLSPGRRNVGITFLFPDAALIKKIEDKAYSGDEEEAVRLIQTLIIPDVFQTSAEFGKRPSGSRFGVKFDVEKAEGDKVVFKGFEIKKVKDFAGLRNENLAVWDLVKGLPPMTGAAYIPPEREMNKTRGGADEVPRLPSTKPLRLLAAEAAEEAYKANLDDSVYLKKAVSLMIYLREYEPLVIDTLVPVLDYDPMATFYILFEPRRLVGHLVSDGIMNEWGGIDLFHNAAAEYCEILSSVANPIDPADFYKAVTNARLEVVQNGGNKRRANLSTDVRKDYKNLVENRSIQGLSNVVPENTARVVRERKLWQDELRFTCHARQGIRSSDEAASFIDDEVAQYRGVDCESEIMFFEKGVPDVGNQKLEMGLLFVFSSDFLHVFNPAVVGEEKISFDEYTVVNFAKVYQARVVGMKDTVSGGCEHGEKGRALLSKRSKK